MGLSLKHKLRISVTEMAREAALQSHDRVDRHLRRAALIVGAFDLAEPEGIQSPGAFLRWREEGEEVAEAAAEAPRRRRQ